jgi:hypothetical protein
MLGKERFHGASERENSQEFAKIKKRRLQKTYDVCTKPTHPEKTIQSQCGAGESCPREANPPEKNQALIRCPLPRFSKRRTLAKT